MKFALFPYRFETLSVKYFGMMALLAAVALLPCSGCSKKQDKQAVAPPVKVGGVVIDKGDITINLAVSGVMKFAANTTISAEVSAQVQSIEVADGQFVRNGDLLLKLDDSKIKEAVEQASANLKRDEASLQFNRTELEKNKGLYSSGSVSHSVYDQKATAHQNSLAQVEAGQALLARAAEDLKKTKVISPISGVISKRYIEKGDWVSEGKRLFQVSEYEQIYLEAFVSDIDVGKLSLKKIRSEGQDAEVTLDAYPGEIFKGRLTYLEPAANDNRLFEIRIYVRNPDMRLLQGMVGRGRINVKTVSDALRVPTTCLLEGATNKSENSVYIVDSENRAQLTRIKIGDSDKDYAVVLEGLLPGSVVVSQGKDVLVSGQLVSVSGVPKP